MTQSDNANNGGTQTPKLLLFALFLVCGISSSTKAQEIVKGTFALSAETRIGSTLLPAGRYTVAIEPVTSINGSATRVLVFVRPDSKSGPVASVFALASEEGCDARSGLTLLSNGTELVARSLCLGKQGIMVDFDLSRSEKSKAVAASAQQ
jgi:hypothetical protein